MSEPNKADLGDSVIDIPADTEGENHQIDKGRLAKQKGVSEQQADEYKPDDPQDLSYTNIKADLNNSSMLDDPHNQSNIALNM